MFNKRKVYQKEFTELELQEAIHEMPQRQWDALVYAFSDQIYYLQSQLGPISAKEPGVIANLAGGIHYLQHFLDELAKTREFKKD